MHCSVEEVALFPTAVFLLMCSRVQETHGWSKPNCQRVQIFAAAHRVGCPPDHGRIAFDKLDGASLRKRVGERVSTYASFGSSFLRCCSIFRIATAKEHIFFVTTVQPSNNTLMGKGKERRVTSELIDYHCNTP